MPIAPVSGAPFPSVTVPTLDGDPVQLGQSDDWALVIVYRGLHCPKCKDYLRALDGLLADFAGLGTSVTVVSGDPEAKARTMQEETGFSGVMGYGMTIDQMRDLGLYISTPLSDAETDQPFAEPGLYIVNDQGNLQVHNISTVSWGRPPLESARDGIAFLRDTGRPPRGTF